MKKKYNMLITALLLCVTLASCTQTNPVPTRVDICIYGGNSAGIIAAYRASLEGKKVLVIEPSGRIGGLTAGGLGQTDIGKVSIIRGLARDFYQRVGQAYGKSEPAYNFEPKVALQIYQEYVKEAGIDVWYHHRIVSAQKKGNQLRSITLEDTSRQLRSCTVEAKVFIDCSYEGDLMARAGVSYTVGRESNAQYGETYNGVQMLQGHQFPDGVDPYCIKGDSTSGLLWGIMKGQPGQQGEADNHVQAYNFRIALTNVPDNRTDITQPEHYDPSHYELMLRLNEVAPWQDLNSIFIWSLMPGGKTDINNRNGFSTDLIGGSWDYPEADYDTRQRIWQEHLDYTKGMLYFLGHDERVPQHIRQEMLQWGYPKDEYTDDGHFTPQLYIRESRRMIGRMVMTEHHCTGRQVACDSVGWAAYWMDSHNCGRYVVNGMVKNEGNVEIPIHAAYPVSYRAITPQEQECSNLLVPVCLSASHIAYGSIRMEPVFMVLGEASAIAACMAISGHNNRVQEVQAPDILNRLTTLEAGQPSEQGKLHG